MRLKKEMVDAQIQKMIDLDNNHSVISVLNREAQRQHEILDQKIEALIKQKETEENAE